MVSSITTTPSTALKLRQAGEVFCLVGSRLFKVGEKLEKLYIKSNGYHPTHLYSNTWTLTNVMWKLYYDAYRVAHYAYQLSKAACLISKVASKNAPILPPAPKTLHKFPCLPAELRLMVWEAAAQPPPCAHYFAKFKLALGGREPAAHFMDDRGLWRACRESRHVVQRVYQKRSAHFANGDCPFDRDSSEMQYRRIARYNKKGVLFKKKIRQLNEELNIGLHRMEHWLGSVVSDKGPFSTETIKEIFAMEPGGKLGEEEVPFMEVETVCVELKDEYLS